MCLALFVASAPRYLRKSWISFDDRKLPVIGLLTPTIARDHSVLHRNSCDRIISIHSNVPGAGLEKLLERLDLLDSELTFGLWLEYDAETNVVTAPCLPVRSRRNKSEGCNLRNYLRYTDLPLFEKRLLACDRNVDSLAAFVPLSLFNPTGNVITVVRRCEQAYHLDSSERQCGCRHVITPSKVKMNEGKQLVYLYTIIS